MNIKNIFIIQIIELYYENNYGNYIDFVYIFTCTLLYLLYMIYYIMTIDSKYESKWSNFLISFFILK